VGVSPAPVGGTRRLQNVFETEARLLGVSGVEAGRRWVSQVALGRAASPEEIASVIVFLASPRDRCGVLRGVPAFVAADCAASGLPVDLGLLAALRFRDVLPFFAVVRSPEIRNTHPRASYPERVK
jgi:NAD(P)-dependent dehydrogenase (short-subunit alcohol dehydrogenase family)